ncbi:PREDICTED: cytochrome P450 4C1-like [Eufriesea mexicana]|uniref:cytochrome P450 4C1-like n=1 Tax=Eufriesea mexicana TaxID=516756 RepID=UPI00083C8E61|nr:PREDICTED: cytochrome P450 4C1-like [Eufriesea mexicana]
MITTILFFAFVLTILHFFILHYRKFGRIINCIPGPQAIPIIGNMHSFQISSSDLWTLMRKMGTQYYPIYRLWSFTTAFLNIRHPDDIETLLGNSKLTKKSHIYTILEPWFNTGLLTGSGRKWHTRRKILTPAFHFNLLQEFVDIFNEEGQHLIEKLKSEEGAVVKDLLPFISEHTLNVICETAMGTSLKDKGSFQYKYRKAVNDMGTIFIYRFVRPWFCYNFIFNLCPQGWRQSKLLKILHGFSRKIIQERKEYHDQTNGRYLSGINYAPSDGVKNIFKHYIVRKKRLAMLDLLIAAHRNNQIDDEGIREEVDTFVFRGHDTTAVSICFTIMLLAEHKEIQDRARVEIKAVMEENKGKLNTSALQNLSYLERCIKESLRLYPSVPSISRAPETDVKLSNYVVPANTIVHVHIIDAHRDPQFWTNPDVFDPDRFLPENSQGRHPYAYIPFSAGPRNCIGQRFAMLELKTTLALLLHNFSLEPVDYLKDVSMNSDIVLRPTYALRTKFVPIVAC